PAAQRDDRAEPWGHTKPTNELLAHDNLQGEMSAVAGGRSNGVHGPRHDQINTELPELGTRLAGIPVRAVAALELGAMPQAIGPHETRVHSERQGGVGKAGMGTDFFLAKVLALQQPGEFALACAVIFLDGMHT